MIKLTLCLFTLYNLILFSDAVVKVDLGGDWKLRDEQKFNNLEATVPGGIYTDLVKNNILGDVFFENNDQNYRWVSKRNWIYSKIFTIDEKVFYQQNINLVFDGIDTFATIYFNNEKLGETDNMFVQYIFDIKKYIKQGNNNLTVFLFSPVEKAEELYKLQALDYVVPPKCVDVSYKGECHVNHIRKMQASFAWDWGPSFPSMGIWKSAYLEAFNSTSIRYVTVNFTQDDSNWNINVTTYLTQSSLPAIQGYMIYTLTTETGKVLQNYQVNLQTANQSEVVHFGNFKIPQIEVNLWWPNGYGNQSLYPLNVTFRSYDGSEVTTKIVKIGFRTIELVQDYLKDNGTTFYFKVNNVSIFMKGTNLIPVSILPELGRNKTQIRFLFNSAKYVHMNMMRIWGGGVYESDELYDIADEYGIILWQDFMFACSMYPVNDQFLKSVREEVRHQVRRLQHHTSIALWAGNNENELALRTNWYGTDDIKQYFEDYVKLYIDVVRDECLKNDDTRPFLTSSPTNGVESDKENFVAQNPGSTLHGDVHYYNYILDSWNVNIYPKARFVSEYGYQSMPSLRTWLTATRDQTNLNISSDFMESRQHHVGGYFEMSMLINKRLKSPENIEEYIYFSQIIQAMAIKIETENYRRLKNVLLDNGEGLTSGALYWQLNDVWVAPTWSSIDFKNRWKMLHYFAKNFFAPVIVTGVQTGDNLDVYVVSDLLTYISNCSVTIQVYNWNSFSPVSEEMMTFDLESNQSKLIKSFYISKYLPEKHCGQNNSSTKLNCFFYLTIKKDEQLLGPNNFVFPVALKIASFEDPEIKIISVDTFGNKTFKIEVETNKIALFVWIEAGNFSGHFSENGFLQISPVKTIYFYLENEISLKDFSNSLTLTQLSRKSSNENEYYSFKPEISVEICTKKP